MSMKGLNWTGVILGASVLLVPWTGISVELFHFIYGMLYLLYVSIYAGQVMSSQVPVPGFRAVETNLGRGAVNMIMLIAVLSTMFYAGYGARGWLMVASSV